MVIGAINSGINLHFSPLKALENIHSPLAALISDRCMLAIPDTKAFYYNFPV